MLCIRFVKSMGILTTLAIVKLFHLLLYKMRADRNVGKKQAVISSFETIPRLLYPSFLQIPKDEYTHLAISYNVCYMFVYSLYDLDGKER